jgi:hypothetical protein
MAPVSLLPSPGGMAWRRKSGKRSGNWCGLLRFRDDRLQDEAAAVREVDDLPDTFPGIRPPVDDVAEHDDRVLGLGADVLDERPQGGGTAVDVANREESVGHGVDEILSVTEPILDPVRTLVQASPLPVGGVPHVGGSESSESPIPSPRTPGC